LATLRYRPLNSTYFRGGRAWRDDKRAAVARILVPIRQHFRGRL
jgi:hypothetical protein